MDVKYVLAGLALVVLVTATGFTVDPHGERDVEPVSFDSTLTMGMTGVDVKEAEERNLSIPRAEVFFSQYEYVVGYYGIESTATHLRGPRTTEQFGEPIGVLVTDYAGTEPALNENGFLIERNSLGGGWVSAQSAVFVVDSRAKTPGGPAIVPFGERSAARSFAERYGGQVVDWGSVQSRSAERTSPATEMDRITANRSQWADRQVTATAGLRDRPVSVVVGEDTPTLAAAIERAPADTTVRLPPGTYDGNVTVDKPLTLTGAGPETHVRGDSEGTVLSVTAERVAVTDLRISGVGSTGARSFSDADGGDWDQFVRLAYGRGDSAIRFINGTGSLVAGVDIETRANGVLVRGGQGLVVRDSHIEGPPEWQDGFMGVLAMFDPVVVQNVTFEGGRDGVYTHRANGIVVRDSRMAGLRFGVHEMYTSGALIRNNTVRRASTGVIVMTRPRANVLRGNDVRASEAGLIVAGSASFVAENVVANNEVGLGMAAARSYVAHNTVVDNGIGIRADLLLPSLTVTGNDVVANDEQAEADMGPVRIWTADGRGNYWGRLPGVDADGDGTLDDSYRPTGAVDGALLRSEGSLPLRESPAMTLLRSVRDRLPGLRASGVVDTAPLTEPTRPNALARTNGSRP
ncbi:NosD domain-containing protein [Halorientalis pallida]|uniref:Copper-binding protein n=1 Tax=Halorientalis pallida TaxID=2479928 RepID=A0A498KVF0_9EURY|nr:NosD domain-containing protein [Halorientalis pallida]RXK49219.1 copper-binding protein [Halorientalis pallida]